MARYTRTSTPDPVNPVNPGYVPRWLAPINDRRDAQGSDPFSDWALAGGVDQEDALALGVTYVGTPALWEAVLADRATADALALADAQAGPPPYPEGATSHATPPPPPPPAPSFLL